MKTKILVLAAAGALAFFLLTTNGFTHQSHRKTELQNSSNAELFDNTENEQEQKRERGQYRKGEGRRRNRRRDDSGERKRNQRRQQDCSCDCSCEK